MSNPIKVSIEHISYPAEVAEKKFIKYYSSLPDKIKETIPKEDLKMAFLEGFDAAVSYLGNLGGEEDIKVELKIDYYNGGKD